MSTMPFSDIKVSEYTERSIVVNGETRKYKEDLKKLGGKYNGNLRGGPGWIFPKTSLKEINAFISNGKRLVSDEEAKIGEEKTEERNKIRDLILHPETIPPPSPSKESTSDSKYNILLNKFKRIEKAIMLLLTTEQKKKLSDDEYSCDIEHDIEENTLSPIKSLLKK